MAKLEELAQLVFLVRGEKVMFDADLAMRYGVEARSLNQGVKRNRKRFPPDFMFQLEVTNCDLKFTWRTSPPPVGLHRTRCSNAFQRASQCRCGRSEYRHYAHVCAATAVDGLEQGSRPH